MPRGVRFTLVLLAVVVALVVAWRESERAPAPFVGETEDASREDVAPRGPSELAGRGGAPRTPWAEVGAPSRRPSPFRLEGRVVEALGYPLAGATVPPVGADAPVSVPDADGRVPSDGHVEPLVVSAGDSFSRVALLPRRAEWSISGVVRDAATRAPIAGMRMHVAPAATPEHWAPGDVTSDDHGAFRVSVPARGAYVLRTGGFAASSSDPASADGFVSRRVGGIAAGRTDVELLLEAGRSIEGSVVGPDGVPVTAYVRFDAIGRTPSGDADYSVRRVAEGASPSGRFRISGLTPGRYDVWITPVLDATTSASDDALAPSVGPDVVAGGGPVTFRLPHGASIVGRLEDGAGGLVTTGGTIRVVRTGERTNAMTVVGHVLRDGTFRAGPFDGTLRYDVLASNFAGRFDGRVEGVSPGDPGIVVVLLPAKSISGKVVGADGATVGAGVPVGVVATDVDPRAEGSRKFAYTKADGSFLADGLFDATFVVEAGGGATALLGGALRGVKAGATDVVLYVRPGVELSGTLVDETGAPVAVTSLQADDGARQAAMRPYVQVGPDGRFAFRGLRGGAVRLSARIRDTYVSLAEVKAPALGVRVAIPAK